MATVDYVGLCGGVLVSLGTPLHYKKALRVSLTLYHTTLCLLYLRNPVMDKQ